MVDSMIAEMKSVTALVEAQCKAGMDENDVKETICRSWISRIQLQTHLRDDHKSALTDAISEGPWDPAQKKLLASTVLASGVKISKSKSVDRRPNQKAHQIENLLPMECMAKLKEVPKYSLASRLSILARSVKALGIENPDNRTLFRLVSIVAYCDPSSSFSQEDTWDHMTTLQKYIKAGGPSKVQYLVDYPPSAVLLPDDIRAAAYAGMEPPELDWKELDQKLADQKVRGERNSKGSRPAKGKKHVLETTPEHQAPTLPAMEQILPSPDTFRLRANSSILPGALEASGKHPGLATGSDATESEHRALCKECGKSLKDDHEHPGSPAPVDLGLDSEPDDLGLDDFENAMRRASSAMKAMAMKSKKTAMNSTMKKPGAAPAMKKSMKVALKRPAAAGGGRAPKDYPGWTFEARLASYPHGCIKCRSKPGCTPSCFIRRGE